MGDMGYQKYYDSVEIAEFGKALEFESKVLRKLVRDFREWLSKWDCECDSYNGHFCGRCGMLGRIDGDLAAIGEERDCG